ncbi:hypothetical protein BDZ89DRAFT_1045808 [Hymenopellis radicata]|nr:hypothetical protein BDZ89DRAFT_1045808 [Hymenopellis radicata]
MKKSFLLPAALLAATSLIHAHLVGRQSTADESSKYVMPVGSPNFYNGQSSAAVTLDQHSLLLDGKRLMVFSGEFHPFRLPAPELWWDVMEKALGLSAPNAEEVRLTEHNDLAAFLDVCKAVGILVIVRPGHVPYVNAETAGGGIPGWVSNLEGLARTNATSKKFSQVLAPYQYPDGPVIGEQPPAFLGESALNVYTCSHPKRKRILHQRELGHPRVERAYARYHRHVSREWAHQDTDNSQRQKRRRAVLRGGLGKVDLYGWDGYPQGFDCDNPSKWTELSTAHDSNHKRLNPAEPLALFEWQGGAFSYWSGPGYEECYKLINEQFVNVFYKNNYAAGTAIQNLYMTYGGTNWGNMHTHTIYSSYDTGDQRYRILTPKIDELKLQAYFLHASPDYLVAGRLGVSNSSGIYTTHLHSPDTDANFYFVRQASVVTLADTDLTLKIPKGGVITLAGRESKIIVTNYPFGSSVLSYTTAEVLTWTTFDGVDTIVLYALEGQYVEVVFQGSGTPAVTPTSTLDIAESNGVFTISGSPSGITVFTVDNTRIIVADKKTAGSIWVYHIDPSALYDMAPDIPAVWVRGPYLLRSASVDGSTLNLYTSVTWNGEPVAVEETEIGTLRGVVTMPDVLSDVTLPVMTDVDWACADSLPELAVDFDDSDWVVANKTSTFRPQQPFAGKYVLYAGEYGFHSGDWVWRGHFTGNATGVSLAIQGGFSFGYSAFINGHFLGSGQGSSHSQQGVDILEPVFNFTSDQLVEGDNVLTVIHDSTGLNQDYNVDDEFKTPRGIRGYTLLSEDGSLDFDVWKVAGNVGGEHAPDYVRGPYNEGGWWFERVGAHLPGYDASSWNQSCTPYDGTTSAGVTAYRTTFDLDLPVGSDVPLAFDFALDSGAPHRVLIFVNGWQFGRFLSTLGPQTSYPIPEGIINHHGTNDVLISFWALNSTGAKLNKLELTSRGVFSSSKTATVDVVAAPGWEELRA